MGTYDSVCFEKTKQNKQKTEKAGAWWERGQRVAKCDLFKSHTVKLAADEVRTHRAQPTLRLLSASARSKEQHNISRSPLRRR